MIKRLDIVKIKSIKNVTWVSGPAARPATPKGNWSVVGNIGNILLIAKDETIAQIPIGDVIKVAEYDINKVIENIKKVRSAADLEKLRKEIANGTHDQRG